MYSQPYTRRGETAAAPREFARTPPRPAPAPTVSAPGGDFRKQRGGTASSVRTRNFGYLVSAAGDGEQLGILLEMPRSRIDELRAGISFTDEIAFHIESELGLPSGWLDFSSPTVPQKLEVVTRSTDSTADDGPPAAAPRLSNSEPISRPEQLAKTVDLQSPHPLPSLPSVTASVEAVVQAAASPVITHKPPRRLQVVADNTTLDESSLPAIVAADQPNDEHSRPGRTFVVKPQIEAACAASPSSAPAIPKEPTMARGVRTNESEEILSIRCLNAQVLTDIPGGKTGVGVLMGKSPANISHVLHGKKKFTRDVAAEWEAALGLPENWMDTPRTSADVPEQARKLMADGFERRHQVAKPASAEKAAKPAKAPRAKRSTEPSATAQSRVSDFVLSLPAGNQESSQQHSATNEPAAAAVPASAEQTRSLPPARAVPSPAPALSFELGETGQAGPLAQALARIVLTLSQRGALTEDRCLRIINEVTLHATPA